MHSVHSITTHSQPSQLVTRYVQYEIPNMHKCGYISRCTACTYIYNYVFDRVVLILSGRGDHGGPGRAPMSEQDITRK
jgi:hypothetical protein